MIQGLRESQRWDPWIFKMFPNPNFNISGIPPWVYGNIQGNLPMTDRNSTLREPIMPPPFRPQDVEPGFLRPPMPPRDNYRNLLAGSTPQAIEDQASGVYNTMSEQFNISAAQQAEQPEISGQVDTQ